MSNSLSFTLKIQAAPKLVYTAFTNQTALNRWLCNASYANASVGGGIFLDWNDGYAAGQFTKLEADKEVGFTWQNGDSPTISDVHVKIEGDDQQSTVEIQHSGLGEDQDTQALEALWNDALENLQSVLESGIDLRIQRRPIMGVMPGAFNPEKAKELGVPVTSGLLISNIMDGFSAAGAGLQVDDVIVSMDGNELGTFQQYLAATTTFKVGQTVEVVYYRGDQKRTTQMLLKERPLPQYPPTLKALVESLKDSQATAIASLHEILDGVDSTILAASPAEGSWSAAEVLAHLIWCERFTQMLIWATERGNNAVPYAGNNAIQLGGILYAYEPTELVDLLETELAVTIGVLETLPEDFEQRRADFAAISTTVGNGPFLGPAHIQGHLPQIQKAIETVAAAV